MSEVSTVGIDLAKSVFQVHGADPSGAVLVRRLRRDQVLGFFATLPRCVVAREARLHTDASDMAAVDPIVLKNSS